jgi:hypothetical protein
VEIGGGDGSVSEELREFIADRLNLIKFIAGSNGRYF